MLHVIAISAIMITQTYPAISYRSFLTGLCYHGNFLIYLPPSYFYIPEKGQNAAWLMACCVLLLLILDRGRNAKVYNEKTLQWTKTLGFS